jgi:hypothetical protein
MMWRWILGGVAGAALYALVTGSIYAREMAKYDRDVNLAGYRLSDAEEIRREAAETYTLKNGHHGHFEQDPAYIAAEAKVEAAANGFPSDTEIRKAHVEEIRYGEWAGGAYVILVLVVAGVRRLAR